MTRHTLFVVHHGGCNVCHKHVVRLKKVAMNYIFDWGHTYLCHPDKIWRQRSFLPKKSSEANLQLIEFTPLLDQIVAHVQNFQISEYVNTL